MADALPYCYNEGKTPWRGDQGVTHQRCIAEHTVVLLSNSFTVDGRGRGLAADTRWHSIADRQMADTARASMTERSRQMRQTTRTEMCVNTAQAAHPAPRHRQLAGLLQSYTR